MGKAVKKLTETEYNKEEKELRELASKVKSWDDIPLLNEVCRRCIKLHPHWTSEACLNCPYLGGSPLKTIHSKKVK